jgi:hypothetical protein
MTEETIPVTPEMHISPSIGEIVKAMSAAQVEYKKIVKDARNPYFNSMYAQLDTVIEATKDALHKNGLVVTQLAGAEYLDTYLMHTSGEYTHARTPLKADKSGPQGYGSAVTYARRQALSAILNVASETDDDANVAQHQRKPSKEEAKRTQPEQTKSWDEVYEEQSSRADTASKWLKLREWLVKKGAPEQILERHKQELELWKQTTAETKEMDEKIKSAEAM